jgi:hypothetical protein
MLRTSCPTPLNEEDDRTNIERTTRLLEQVTGHRPVNSLCLDRTRRRLVVHEHEIIRVCTKNLGAGVVVVKSAKDGA